MRKRFFTRLDALLPRWVALMPYRVALVLIQAIFLLLTKTRVWNRNSTKLGTFTMGVSDLDLTVVSWGNVSYEMLRYSLGTLKRLVIFLGEANYYHASHLSFILRRMNPLELRRDPLLQKHTDEREITPAHKFVFIQRMLFSDYFSLKENPSSRKAKWQEHLKAVGCETGGEEIDLAFVLNYLKKLSQNNPRISSALDLWASEVRKDDFDVFHHDFGDGFRILAPHCYLWFHHRDESEFLNNLTGMEKEILRNQIDWEFWGVYTQRYHLSEESMKLHLSRLVKVYEKICPSEEAEKFKKELALAI